MSGTNLAGENILNFDNLWQWLKYVKHVWANSVYDEIWGTIIGKMDVIASNKLAIWFDIRNYVLYSKQILLNGVEIAF